MRAGFVPATPLRSFRAPPVSCLAMGKLDGKNALIFGVANERSLAWGIAQALHADGATLGFGYTVPVLEKRVTPLAESLGSDWIEYCDITSDDSIAATIQKAKDRFGNVDILIHSIAFA